MELDLLLRGGRIVDGSGLPAFIGDVAIRGGRIVGVEPTIDGTATRTLDVRGLVVAPGFIDIHTHYDAQVIWDPELGSSARHGITTVLAGNCGFTVAPVRAGDEDYIIQMLSRVEGMPARALREGLPWSWESFGDYLAQLSGRLGVNLIAQVGHSALRRYVMGDAAFERAATAAEIEAMAEILAAAVEAGAWGLSTSTSPTHNDSMGRPVPSRQADQNEMLGLATVLRDRAHGIIGISPGSKFVGINPDERALLVEMALRSRAVVHWNPLVYSREYPDLHSRSLEVSAQARAAGARVVAVFNPGPSGPSRVDIASGFLFEALPHWKQVIRLPQAERLAAYADSAVRDGLKADFEDDSALGHLTAKFRAMWPGLYVTETYAEENQKYTGLSIGAIAGREGRQAMDVMLDIAVRDDLRSVFMRSEVPDADPEALEAVLSLARHPDVVFGGSDAGAHLDFMSNEPIPSRALAARVRDQAMLSLEDVVCGFTGRLAEVFGISDRGKISAGLAADVVVLDLAEVGAGSPRLVQDLPGQSERFVTEPKGVAYTIVNGTVVCENGDLNGELPGRVL